MWSKEFKVDPKQLLDGLNDHIEWIDNTVNGINKTTGGALTSDAMSAVAFLCKTKKKARQAISKKKKKKKKNKNRG
ncbi:MAG: hypothetical protein ABS894_00985, partial [Aerococcus urinaeequi]